MVSARIHPHVGSRDHVAFDTGGTRGAGFMVVVRWKIVPSWIVAADAERVAFDVQLAAVGLVTVRAGYAFGMHSALKKGSVDIDLIQDLAIVVIETCFDEAQQVGLREG